MIKSQINDPRVKMQGEIISTSVPVIYGDLCHGFLGTPGIKVKIDGEDICIIDSVKQIEINDTIINRAKDIYTIQRLINENYDE